MFLIGNAKHRPLLRLCTFGVKTMKNATQNHSPAIAAIIAAANPNAPAIAPRDTSSKGTATKAAKTAPKLAEKLAQATAPQTAATKAKAQAKAKPAKVEIVVTQPNEVNKRTEAYKLFTEIGKTNEKIYAFFNAHKADLFKTVESGVQVDAANAYKKCFEVSHTRGASTPLKDYPMYKEFTNKLAYWVKHVAKIATVKKPSSTTPSNAVQAYLKKHADSDETVPAIKAFIAGAFTKAQWDALKAQLDTAFASVTIRKVSKVKNAA